MDHRHSEEALEAGEDGVFDLGDPCPTPSPVKAKAEGAAQPVPDNQAPQVEIPIATPAQASLEEEKKREEAATASIVEQEQIATQEGKEEVDNTPPSELSNGVAGEDFEDAVETLRPEDSQRAVDEHMANTADMADLGKETAEKTTATLQNDAPGGGVDIQPPTKQPGPVSEKSYISAGLSNVKLPMPYKRWTSEGIVSEANDDSEGEGEFHDAYDTIAGLAKDAAKALEMKEAGNAHYKCGDFDEAADFYSLALEYCPDDDEHKQDRAVYLGNRAACHLQLQEFEPVVDDCTAALELNPLYVKALLRRAQANEKMEKYDVALEDMNTLLEIDPGSKVARESAPRLEKLHKEKMEKMKDEAIGKLKELGNSLLGHFGLSTDNFKMKQDPNTGSYSINFER